MATALPTLDSFPEQFADRFNPVLVKEVRQFLKNKHFGVTFLLLLLFAWLFSFLFVLRDANAIAMGEQGPLFFSVYFRVLMLPLCFIVPMFVYHSVAEEFQEHTFDMLAITLMSPQQIAGGKMQCSIVHMMIYYSAIGPFLAFTYLLRGINILTILFYLLVSFFVSIAICLLAIMLASVTKRSAWGILSLLFLMAASSVSYLICFAAVSPSALWDIGLGDVVGLVAGMLCVGYMFLFFALTMLGISMERLTATNRMVKPYRVRKLPDGTVQFFEYQNLPRANDQTPTKVVEPDRNNE